MQARLVREYPQMLDILGKGILNMKSPAMPGFFDKLANYYSEPTLKGLYTDAVRQYDNVSQIEQALGNGFTWLKTCFPSMRDSGHLYARFRLQSKCTGRRQPVVHLDR